MNLIDIIIIAVMLFLLVRGIFRGFFREIASIAGVIFGILLAVYFLPQATVLLRRYLPSSEFLQIISFAIVFISVLIICNLIGWALKTLFKKASIGWIDRILGAGLAVLKGVILIYLFIVLITFLVPSRTNLIVQSKLAPLIIASYQSITRSISPKHYEGLKKTLSEKYAELSDAFSDRIKGNEQR